MAGGKDSIEESIKVESSATTSYDSNTNDSGESDSEVQSRGKREDARNGLSNPQQEPTVHELERQSRIKRNANILQGLDLVNLAAEIEVANRKRSGSKAVTTEKRRSGSSKCVVGRNAHHPKLFIYSDLHLHRK